LRVKFFFISFLKYQTAALLATLVDFGVFFLLKDVFHIWYVYATAIGALTGAITNFILCRNWAFSSREKKLVTQIGRYIMVSLGSLLLNTVLVYVITELFKIHENYSRVMTAILVAVTYNFTLQKYFVFKK
jgi:putative flippase GtrA|tara:strand:+ start:176896 stop:177288 length:393 start_codon:yes stop_codon:yes gene_type:complete